MSDLIRRKEAIDAIEEIPFYEHSDYRWTIEAIDKLPAALKCRDCKHYPYGWRRYGDNGQTLNSYQHCFHFGEDDFCSRGEPKTEDPKEKDN